MKVLIIDDEKAIRDAVKMILEYEHFETDEAATGKEGLDRLQATGDVGLVLCDVKMPGMDGLDVLKKVRARHPDVPVIMISGHGTVETAVEATRRGAFDFLEKPLDRDRLLVTVRNALGQRELRESNTALRQEIAREYRIQGSSPVMESLRAMILRVAQSDARVLITGENGTGKELVARNLHLLSERRNGPWVDLNCAAIPRELIESELFGHEKGAFTGATARKPGKFELARRGTLFLDEIGDMPLEAQAKMLRVLEEEEVQRVGGSEKVKVDVRVVAATNKDLIAEVEAGRFREDLYYRLNVIPLEVPPLRERGNDVIELFGRFLDEACKRHGRSLPVVTREAASWLKSQTWPGNVRQLRNLAERVALLHQEDSLAAPHLAELSSRNVNSGAHDDLFSIPSFETFKETAERIFLQRHLEANGWNIKRTAELLGMQRSNLYKKIERHGLKKP